MRQQMIDAFIDTIVAEIESTAHWRRDKATEYPNDRRNDTAADILDRLAEAVRVSPRSDAALRLQKLNEELILRSSADKNFDISTLIIECDDYRRRIGFSEFLNTADEYLATLAAVYHGHLNRTRERGLRQGVDEIRQLRMAADNLRSKVSQGSYGDEQLQLFWKFTQSAGPILKISNSDLSIRAGLGDGFFMSVSRDHRRPKLVNFLKAMTTIVEVADERLAAIERTGPSLDRTSPRKGSEGDSRIVQDRDDLLGFARALRQMALDEIKRLDDERPNDPGAIESNKKYRELLEIFADGFERIAVALGAVEGKKPETLLVSKAREVVKSVGNQVNDWFSTNGAEVVDWSMRIPFCAGGVAALGWAGANMTVATTAIVTLVGGQKVADVLLRRNKGARKAVGD
jgi:hypothetical protein